MRARSLIILGASIWCLIGIFLLMTGLRLLQGAVFLMITALFVGQLKGRYVLAKAALKQSQRIYALPAPLHIKNLYSKGYYFLILGMMALGMSLRFLPFPLEVRGWIDTAVGAALIRGSIFYFRLTKT